MYTYVKKHAHTKMKKPRKSCFCECNENCSASVAWNMSFYHKAKDFRLCKCRTLKTSCTNIVKFKLCECNVQIVSLTKILGCTGVEPWNQIVLANVVKVSLSECNVK